MFFGTETNRVIREKWKSLEAFSQELWQLFQGNLPITQNAPVTITQRGDSPPLTISQPEDSTVPPIVIKRGDTTVSIGDLGNNSPSAAGGIDLGSIDFPNADPAVADNTPPPDQNPFVLYGEVVGQDSGNTYDCRVYARPPASGTALAVIKVRFPQVDPADTLPQDFVPVLVLCFPQAVPGTTKKKIVDAVAIAPVFLPRGT